MAGLRRQRRRHRRSLHRRRHAGSAALAAAGQRRLRHHDRATSARSGPRRRCCVARRKAAATLFGVTLTQCVQYMSSLGFNDKRVIEDYENLGEEHQIMEAGAGHRHDGLWRVHAAGLAGGDVRRPRNSGINRCCTCRALASRSGRRMPRANRFKRGAARWCGSLRAAPMFQTSDDDIGSAMMRLAGSILSPKSTN